MAPIMEPCACGGQKNKGSATCWPCYVNAASSSRKRACVICLKGFLKSRTSRTSGQCCSRQCGFELQRRARAISRAKTAAAKQAKRESSRRDCAVCGAKSKTRYCSRRCYLDSLKLKAARMKPLTERTCKQCRKTFAPEYGNKRRIFCSIECGRRHVRRTRKHRTRAKKYGAKYEPVPALYICKRDGWRCQLCGVATPQRLRGKNEPNSPEIDHIVPISAGGAHVPENLQLACRACNGRKSNTVAGQLRLVG